MSQSMSFTMSSTFRPSGLLRRATVARDVSQVKLVPSVVAFSGSRLLRVGLLLRYECALAPLMCAATARASLQSTCVSGRGGSLRCFGLPAFRAALPSTGLRALRLLADRSRSAHRLRAADWRAGALASRCTVRRWLAAAGLSRPLLVGLTPGARASGFAYSRPLVPRVACLTVRSVVPRDLAGPSGSWRFDQVRDCLRTENEYCTVRAGAQVVAAASGLRRTSCVLRRVQRRSETWGESNAGCTIWYTFTHLML